MSSFHARHIVNIQVYTDTSGAKAQIEGNTQHAEINSIHNIHIYSHIQNICKYTEIH